MRKGKRFLHILAFVAIFAIAIAVVMLLWNALIPSVIGWSAINYWQAGGLMILSRLLFGGLGHHKHKKHFFSRPDKAYFMQMHSEMKNMSRDERRDFIRQRMAHGRPDFCDEHKPSADAQDKE